jgi:two-component system, NarL family, invasion response regulator UvrY
MVRILIADDNHIVRQGLKRLFGRTGDMIVAGEASNGQDAIQMLSEEVYDIVLLDIAMPGKNGLEVLKEIRARKFDVPVLILSTHSESQYASRAMAAGACGYLTKEKVSEHLTSMVRKICSEGNPA